MRGVMKMSFHNFRQQLKRDSMESRKLEEKENREIWEDMNTCRLSLFAGSWLPMALAKFHIHRNAD